MRESMSWGINRLDADFARRQRTIGAVVFNGEMNRSLVTRARSAANPYYPHARGSDSNNFEKIAEGDIVYTIRHTHTAMNAISHTGVGGNQNAHNRLKGMSVLNGHGRNNEDNHMLMQTMQIIGIAELSNIEEPSQLYTLLRKGIRTVCNNSNETIEPGDSIMAYAPSTSEMSLGGRGKASDKNGEVKLWYKRYDPTLHAFKKKQIYQYLAANNADKELYSNRFGEACKKFKQSIMDTTLTVIAANYDKIKFIMNTATTIPNGLNELLKEFDKIVNSDGLHKTFKQVLVPYSSAQLIEPDKNAQSELNKRQHRCIDEFLTATSQCIHETRKTIIGTALTTAAPKKDFTIDIDIK